MIGIVVEGDTDLPVARKLIADAGFGVAFEIDSSGKADIDERLDGYNAAAQGSPWFVLRDLDDDAQCPGDYLASLGWHPSALMCFRLAVREVEAWLLADAAGLSKYLGVRSSDIPSAPDQERDPTQTLVNLARRSRKRWVVRDLVPTGNGGTQVGRLYEARIIEFGREHWDLDRACVRSESLRRARHCLRELSKRWGAVKTGAARTSTKVKGKGASRSDRL